MIEIQKSTNEPNSTTGASNCLTCLPIKELGYELNKEQFQYAIRVRYNQSTQKLFSVRVYVSRFDVANFLLCKKEGLVNLRQNEIHDLASVILAEVCSGVRREPRIVELEKLILCTTNQIGEARLDICTTGVLDSTEHFFNIRGFDLNTRK